MNSNNQSLKNNLRLLYASCDPPDHIYNRNRQIAVWSIAMLIYMICVPWFLAKAQEAAAEKTFFTAVVDVASWASGLVSGLVSFVASLPAQILASVVFNIADGFMNQYVKYGLTTIMSLMLLKAMIDTAKYALGPLAAVRDALTYLGSPLFGGAFIVLCSGWVYPWVSQMTLEEGFWYGLAVVPFPCLCYWGRWSRSLPRASPVTDQQLSEEGYMHLLVSYCNRLGSKYGVTELQCDLVFSASSGNAEDNAALFEKLNIDYASMKRMVDHIRKENKMTSFQVNPELTENTASPRPCSTTEKSRSTASSWKRWLLCVALLFVFVLVLAFLLGDATSVTNSDGWFVQSGTRSVIFLRKLGGPMNDFRKEVTEFVQSGNRSLIFLRKAGGLMNDFRKEVNEFVLEQTTEVAIFALEKAKGATSFLVNRTKEWFSELHKLLENELVGSEDISKVFRDLCSSVLFGGFFECPF